MDVAAQVLECFKDAAEREVKPDELLVDLKMDSLMVLSLVYLLEQRMEISISDDYMNQIQTASVQDVVDYVSGLVKGK
jgi:acyl carrier protein